MMTEFAAQIDDFRFVCADHDKVMDTINQITAADTACHYCGATPIVIVYRSLSDKIAAACKEHREIVEEMIERDKV